MTENKHKIKSQESYRRLMEASNKVFARHGYVNASIDMLTKEAGYTKGTFYLHFANKEEFFLTLMEAKLEAFKEHFLPLLHIDEPMEKWIDRGIALFYEISTEENWIPIYFEFCANAIRNESVKERMSAYYREWIDMISMVLQKGVHMKQLPEDLDTNKMAASIVAILDGYNMQRSIAGSSIDPKALAQIIKGLLKLPVRKNETEEIEGRKAGEDE